MIILALFAVATQIAQKKINSRKEKRRQFECGFRTINPSHVPFSFQFFLIAILFLIFDVEISIILSYPIEKTITKSLILIILFILILTIGLIYE